MRLPLLAITFVPIALALMKMPGSDSSQQQPGTFSRLTSALKGLTGGASSSKGASTGAGLGGGTGLGMLHLPGMGQKPSAASSAPPDNGPGSVACSDLLTKLGAAKVIIDKKAGTYVETTSNYWCDRNTLLSPSCVVLPTTTAEVSIIIKSITSAKAKFAVSRPLESPATLPADNVSLSALQEVTTLTLASLLSIKES